MSEASDPGGSDAAGTIEFPVPLYDFIKVCEVGCVAGCCGIDVFEFEPGSLQGERDLTQFDLAIEQLEEISKRVRASPSHTFGSALLNWWAPAADWVPLLERIRWMLVAGKKMAVEWRDTPEE